MIGLCCAVSLVLLLVFFLFIRRKRQALLALPIKTLQELRMETGDLLLFRWHAVDTLHELFSSFTHVGMVVRMGSSNTFVLETHRKGDTNSGRGGVHVYNLADRVQSYEGDNFILKMRPGLMTEQLERQLLAKVPSYKQIPFYDQYREHYQGYCVPKMACNSCLMQQPRTGMFCSEFAGHLLQDMGILEKSVSIACLTPGSFATGFPHIYNSSPIRIRKTSPNIYSHGS